jgi:hypothetical protein
MEIDEFLVEVVCDVFVGDICFAIVECDGCVFEWLCVFVFELFDGPPEYIWIGCVVEGLEVVVPLVCFVLVDGCLYLCVKVCDAWVSGVECADVVSFLDENFGGRRKRGCEATDVAFWNMKIGGGVDGVSQYLFGLVWGREGVWDG